MNTHQCFQAGSPEAGTVDNVCTSTSSLRFRWHGWCSGDTRTNSSDAPSGRGKGGAQTLSAAALWVSDADVLQIEGGSNCCQYGIYYSHHRFTFPAKTALIWSSHRFLKFQWKYYLFTCASTEKHKALLIAVYLLKQSPMQNWEAPLYCRTHSILYKRMPVRAEVWSIMANSEIDPVKAPVLWCDGVIQIWCVYCSMDFRCFSFMLPGLPVDLSHLPPWFPPGGRLSPMMAPLMSDQW